jgi:hypothetical protein
MSTPEQPAQGLTRKQMRELRMTGATPIVTAESDAPADTEDTHDGAVEQAENAAEVAEVEVDVVEDVPAAPAVPLPRPAEPVFVPEPTADSHVDLGVSPLTRRQAREQERIRTASVPVITPEVIAAHAAEIAEREGAPASEEVQVLEVVEPTTEVSDATAEAETVDAPHDVVEPENVDEQAPAEAVEESADDVVEERAEEDAPALAEGFGSHLLAEPEPAAVPLAPSFDELIARNGSTTGSAAAPNALILQSPDGPSLAGPITATGEVLITGSLPLEGVGSKGHAPGIHDGKEVDAVLIDGELPAHSSPTPIAASAAISTVKSAGEIIRPPAPERGSRLMLWLAITAGALALALVGVLIIAFVTGSI